MGKARTPSFSNPKHQRGAGHPWDEMKNYKSDKKSVTRKTVTAAVGRSVI